MNNNTVSVLTDEELSTLKEYIIPNALKPEDKDIMYNLTLLQFAELGFHENQDGTLEETAKLTKTGEDIIELKKLQKSPLSVLYRISPTSKRPQI